MLNSRTFGIPIARPADEVFEFLIEPTNFAKWAFVGDTQMRHLSGRDWQVETSVGTRILRFAEWNGYGILDHFSLLTPDDTPHPIAMRVIANEGGTELAYTCFQRPDMTDEQWASMIEWVTADLLALKSLLEAGEE
jgi:hypothetical protein